MPSAPVRVMPFDLIISSPLNAVWTPKANKIEIEKSLLIYRGRAECNIPLHFCIKTMQLIRFYFRGPAYSSCKPLVSQTACLILNRSIETKLEHRSLLDLNVFAMCGKGRRRRCRTARRLRDLQAVDRAADGSGGLTDRISDRASRCIRNASHGRSCCIHNAADS